MNSGIVGVSQNNVFGTNTAQSKLTINGGTFQNTGTGAAGRTGAWPMSTSTAAFTMDIFRRRRHAIHWGHWRLRRQHDHYARRRQSDDHCGSAVVGDQRHVHLCRTSVERRR